MWYRCCWLALALTTTRATTTTTTTKAHMPTNVFMIRQEQNILSEKEREREKKSVNFWHSSQNNGSMHEIMIAPVRFEHQRIKYNLIARHQTSSLSFAYAMHGPLLGRPALIVRARLAARMRSAPTETLY